MITLSERLQNVAELVTPGLRVADIGCDHGYLSIYLMENRLSEHIIAMDINRGPLERAKENIEQAGLSAYIETRLSDGLQELKKNEADCLVMAGMGGRLMIHILDEKKELLQDVNEIILQPQSEVMKVRQYLEQEHYLILQEAFVCEEYKYYPMMKAIHGDMKLEKEIYYKYGKLLFQEKNQVFHAFLQQEKQYYSKLYCELACQEQTERMRERLKDVEKELSLSNEALALMET